MGNYFSDEDINAILEKYEESVQKSGKKGVDLFICNQWPMNILKYTSDEFPDMYFNFSTKIAKLINEISPRYIVTSSCDKDLFYQRNIYMNNDGFATRFVSLSSMPNPDSKTSFKDKYVHALSIKPLVHLSSDELREPTFAEMITKLSQDGENIDFEELQSKLPPAIRNPFLAPNNSIDYLLKEKLELGHKFMAERKIQTGGDDEESSEEENRDGNLLNN